MTYEYILYEDEEYYRTMFHAMIIISVETLGPYYRFFRGRI